MQRKFFYPAEFDEYFLAYCRDNYLVGCLRAKISIGAQEEFKKFYSKWLLKESPVRVGATISEIDTPIQTPKDMVFSQTSHKTQSILKVVDLDRLKPEKSQQVNGSTGVVTDNSDGLTLGEATPPSPMATTSFSEVRSVPAHGYLKPEPLYDTKMFHDSDSEFFQDLVQWCSTPAKEEQVQTIDSNETEKRALTVDTTQIHSPQSWDVFDPISPNNKAGFYSSTPVDPLSPNIEGVHQFDNNYLGLPEIQKENKIQFQEQFLDISSLPVVIGEMTQERAPEAHPWPTVPHAGWANTYETDYTQTYTNTHNTMPFIDQEDSLDIKLVSVMPREVESNNVLVSEYVVKDNGINEGVLLEPDFHRRNGGLSVDVAARAQSWSNEIVSTPEILSYVEQLEKEKCPQIMKTKQLWPVQETTAVADPITKMDIPSPVDYEPVTPKSESNSIVESDQDDNKSHSSKRRRHDSEDSDETYTPYPEPTPRKYKRRKPNIPIKEMILALEGSQQMTKARRGRPPKRRESNVSSACSIDENSSCASTHETKYRELRDKNNEASKRSRMNRKLKELQMEQLATDLEEKNKKLKVKADILEDMTKRLKEALMTAILQK